VKTFSREKLLLEPPPLGGVLYLSGFPGGGNKSHDKSPYGNIGTLTGATWTKLPSGPYCLDFDGIDDYVSCGNSPSFNVSAITVSAWVRLDAYNADGSVVISKGFYSLDTGWTLFVSSAGQAKFYINSWSTKVAYFPTVLSLNKWYHLAGAYNRQNIRIFVNALEGTAYAMTEAMTTNTEQVRLGTRAIAGSYYHNGNIALPRVMNRPLSALDIANIYNRERWLFEV